MSIARHGHHLIKALTQDQYLMVREALTQGQCQTMGH